MKFNIKQHWFHGNSIRYCCNVEMNWCYQSNNNQIISFNTFLNIFNIKLASFNYFHFLKRWELRRKKKQHQRLTNKKEWIIVSRETTFFPFCLQKGKKVITSPKEVPDSSENTLHSWDITLSFKSSSYQFIFKTHKLLQWVSPASTAINENQSSHIIWIDI